MSEPFEKVVKFDSVSGILKQNQEDEEIEFYLRICGDIFLEILKFGDRRRLTKVERVGRQFHGLIDGYYYFAEKPFLRLDIQLKLREGGGLMALIGTDLIGDAAVEGKEISLQDLALFPAFLRFAEVYLTFFYGSQSIAEKCDLFDGCLQSIKPALNDSNLIRFNCAISEYDPEQFSEYIAGQFSNHQTLIEYLRHRLLPICESSRSYSFLIGFVSDFNSASNIIDSILQMAQIIRYGCFGVYIVLIDTNPAQLPIETISTWLNRKSGAMEIHQKQNVLHIYSSETFQNIPEMCDFLKMEFMKDMHSTPYSFELESRHADGQEQISIEDHFITNKMTKEQLSISKRIFQNSDGNYDVIKFIRTLKKEKKAQQKQ